MWIEVKNAREHNLKNISFLIPQNSITGITGVSGSGKSTILKNILAAYGNLNYTRLKSKTINESLNISNFVQVDIIKNLPQTIFIDFKNHVNNSNSTLATLSGIQENLKTIFNKFSKTYCLCCNNKIKSDIFNSNFEIEYFKINFIYDANFSKNIEILEKLGTIIKKDFFDKNFKATNSKRLINFTTVTFSSNDINANQIKNLRKLSNEIFVKLKDINIIFNPFLYTACKLCKILVPRISRSRISFNTKYEDGGGACKICNGSGKNITILSEKLIKNINNSLFNDSIEFINESGIKYTKIDANLIKTFCKENNINIKNPLKQLSDKQINLIFFGSKEKLKTYTKKDKEYYFDGLVKYLEELYLRGIKKDVLEPYILEKSCFHCKATRIDPLIDSFKIDNLTLREILRMNIGEFLNEILNLLHKSNSKEQNSYLNILKNKLESYLKVSCSHLFLNRDSSSLSGGEIQRIRLCSALNSDIQNICYLLDEPTNGLHYEDIDNFINFLLEIKNKNNTIIFTEHNKKLLDSCDFIIDIGPEGGNKGGEVLFADYNKNLNKYNTATSNYLLETEKLYPQNQAISKNQKYLEFFNLNQNNLKNINIKIPYNHFSVICGVSGSGKSTLLTKVIYKEIFKQANKFGFEEVIYLAQKGIKKTASSNVAITLQIMDYVAKIYSKISNLDKKYFLKNSTFGKCEYCNAKGYLTSQFNENIGICQECNGKIYNKKTLEYKISNLNIFEILNTSFSELSKIIKDKNILKLCHICIKLGIGYLTMQREVLSLSKGEYQRVLLARVLFKNEKNKLYLLDEPSSGLHHKNSLELAKILKEIANNNNTIIAVEHNLTMINSSDYIIELGNNSKNDGGYLLYNGETIKLKDAKNSKISKIITQIQDKNEKTKKSTSIEQQKITLELNDDKVKEFEQKTDYYLKDLSEILINSYRNLDSKFLNLTIPNNILFSKILYPEINIQAPLIFLIDFKAPKYKFELNVYNALNIKHYLINAFIDKYPNEKTLLRHLMDDKSQTGKCLKCSGSGKIETIDRKFFIINNELTKEAKNFLNKIKNLKKIKEYLKTELQIDLDKDLSLMNKIESDILFDGFNKIIDFEGEKIHYKGLIENTIINHNSYKTTHNILKLKYKTICNACNCELIDDKYQIYTYLNLNYSKWMNFNTKKLENYILNYKNETEESFYKKNILNIIDTLNNFCDEKISLITNINDYNEISRGIIKLVSLYKNNIFGTMILIKNSEILNYNQKQLLDNIVEKWKLNNTIFFV